MAKTRIPLDVDCEVDPFLQTGNPMQPAKPELSDEDKMYLLATLTPADQIDWRAEYAKAFREVRSLRERLATKEHPLEAQMLALAERLLERTGNSVKVGLACWSHLGQPDNRDVDFSVYFTENSKHVRGETFEEVVTKADAEAAKLAKPELPPCE